MIYFLLFLFSETSVLVRAFFFLGVRILMVGQVVGFVVLHSFDAILSGEVILRWPVGEICILTVLVLECVAGKADEILPDGWRIYGVISLADEDGVHYGGFHRDIRSHKGEFIGMYAGLVVEGVVVVVEGDIF